LTSSCFFRFLSLYCLCILFVLFIFICVFFFFLFMLWEFKEGIENLSQKINLGGVGRAARAVDEDNLIPDPTRLSKYLVNVKKRNIFQPWEPPEVKNIVEVTEKNKTIANKTENLRLVGLSWFDHVDTASAMIEDIEKQVTYFLQKGEKVGDIVVKTIYADSVELGYDNEEIIIRYDKSQM
ncbi:MAG: hypothetical protein KC733_07375, partial [Candidatus Omnitrophica bacterium]|nr:hypothetical protein [Candidatus Omnitrophota bacterium]